MALSVSHFPRNPAQGYDAVRNGIRNGDVLLCSGTGIFSAMIQQATGSVWSHVGFVLRLDEINRIMLLESVESIGVRTVRLSKYLMDYGNDHQPYPGGLVIIRNRKFEPVLDPPRLARLSQYAVDQFGYPYDSEEIAKIAARILAAKVPFTRKQYQRIKPNREFICSEYVARCYQQAGVPVPWNKLGFIAPSDFAADPDFSLLAVLKRP